MAAHASGHMPGVCFLPELTAQLEDQGTAGTRCRLTIEAGSMPLSGREVESFGLQSGRRFFGVCFGANGKTCFEGFSKLQQYFIPLSLKDCFGILA